MDPVKPRWITAIVAKSMNKIHRVWKSQNMHTRPSCFFKNPKTTEFSKDAKYLGAEVGSISIQLK
ncbi:hypothetical protein DPMN_017847 [Dreissena polymorpha]|uniref:Uncharacterized protein n=1 Tax=Dreissena polymorpha TaxID=45954 RepID=A0A9D4NIB4_DREPO|nr:hypothetical protein DPMN_017847 [Dreissena polymorpha]